MDIGTLSAVPHPVKKRRYDASGRRAAAEQTRRSVLLGARDLFTTRGYAATSVADVAAAAAVSVDTVYASVGRKPQLLLAVLDMTLAEGDEPVDAEERGYVRAIREAPTAREKIAVYADALGRLLPRTVPLLVALRAAGESDADCRATYLQVSERRRANMARFAEELKETGELRSGLAVDTVADLVWSMNSPDFYLLVTSRGHGPQQYAALVRDVWTRTFLREPGG